MLINFVEGPRNMRMGMVANSLKEWYTHKGPQYIKEIMHQKKIKFNMDNFKLLPNQGPNTNKG